MYDRRFYYSLRLNVRSGISIAIPEATSWSGRLWVQRQGYVESDFHTGSTWRSRHTALRRSTTVLLQIRKQALGYEVCIRLHHMDHGRHWASQHAVGLVWVLCLTKGG